MNIFVLEALGLGFIGLGLFNVFNRDWLWERQARVNASRGTASERTDAWDNRQILVSMSAVLIGILFIVAGLLSGFSPQPPAGEYICLPTGSMTENAANKTLILQSSGQGSYDGLPLTWTSMNGNPKQVAFAGDIPFVSGEFPIKDDSKSFVVTESTGEKQLCLLR